MKLKDLEYIIEDNCRVCLCDRYGHRIHTDGCLILTLDLDGK